jgi:phage baseplate assembly protein W
MDYLSGAALVRQSIRLILATEPGERIMRPDFGCGLRQFLMAPNTPGTRAAIGRAVQAALRRWETRIVVRGIDVSAAEDPAVAWVTVSYTHVRDGTPASVGVQVPVGTAAR